MSFFQKLGRALQLPIAVLPVAALFVRLGHADLLNIPALTQAGSAIFDHLPLIFAIGIASAWSIHSSGAAALSGAISYLVLIGAMTAIDPKIDMGALAGIISGLIAGISYNRWKDLKLPDFLAFFGGSRSIPIISSVLSLFLALILAQIWPPIQTAIDLFGNQLQNFGALGPGIYGILNRLLLPTGLHQILNNYVWYQLGHFQTPLGKMVAGDTTRFYAGDPNAGFFLAGFFPIMIFGLPAAALAMIHAASKERRKAISGILLSVSFTAMLTGITEPLEFLFMFLAPVLYSIHIFFTGLSLFLCAMLNIRAGFSFSAGLIDLLLVSTFPNTQNLGRLLGVGLLFSCLYYLSFYLLIRFFDLKVPAVAEDIEPFPQENVIEKADLGEEYLQALGGAENLISLESCITRLRLQLHDCTQINQEKLQHLGALGFSQLDHTNFQVIIGTQAESVCKKIQQAWDASNASKSS